jgi:hypothetical protein
MDHERMAPDGLSCWAWAVDDPAPPWSPGKRPDLDGWEVIHLWRDPLLCIPAMAADEKPQTLKFIERHVGPTENALERAAKTWVTWHQSIPTEAEHVNVEQAVGWAQEKYKLPLVVVPSNTTNTRAGGQREPTTWEAIAEAAGEAIAHAVYRDAVERGYA